MRNFFFKRIKRIDCQCCWRLYQSIWHTIGHLFTFCWCKISSCSESYQKLIVTIPDEFPHNKQQAHSDLYAFWLVQIIHHQWSAIPGQINTYSKITLTSFTGAVHSAHQKVTDIKTSVIQSIKLLKMCKSIKNNTATNTSCSINYLHSSTWIFNVYKTSYVNGSFKIFV